MVNVLSPKVGSLLCLLVQNAGLVMLMRYSRSRKGVPMFLASTAVTMDELSKFTLSILMIYMNFKASQRLSSKRDMVEEEVPELAKDEGCHKSFTSFMRVEVVTRSSLLMAVPALLYTIQKNLLYVAISNLDACVYQVTYSAKLLTTAVFSFLILGTRFSFWQRVGLAILMMGVAMVQISQIAGSPKKSHTDERPIVGFVAVSLACVTSGFASVYFEYWLKKSQDFWIKQAQLAFYALILAICAVITQDSASVRQNGFFQGYDGVVVLTIAMEAGGGIIVALVTKYADSIAKNFVTALSLTLTTCLSAMFFEFQVSASFVLGAIMTLGASYIYQQSSWPAPSEMMKAVMFAAPIGMLVGGMALYSTLVPTSLLPFGLIPTSLSVNSTAA